MTKRRVLRGCATFMICTIMTGCAGSLSLKAENLMTAVEPKKEITGPVTDKQFIESVADFSANLLKESNKEAENIMISPISVYAVLTMLANGAAGTTKEQLESVLYNGQEAEDMNQNVAKLMNGLVNTEDATLHLANSLWYRNDQNCLSVQQDFLQINADYYNADLYKGDFSSDTCDDINEWCDAKTDGMIQEALDEIPEDAVMYLINAICFEAKWEEEYEEENIEDGIFYGCNGDDSVSFMSSEEESYIKTDDEIGFIKPYMEGYSFVAVMPAQEEMSLTDYIDTLTGERFLNIVTGAEETPVQATMPAFTSTYDGELSEQLSNIGITDLFDESLADLTNMAESSSGNIFVSRMIHKTYIEVDEQGTKAAAVTIGENDKGSSCPSNKLPEVRLNRPFVYAIIDENTNLPVFIGTVQDI